MQEDVSSRFIGGWTSGCGKRIEMRTNTYLREYHGANIAYEHLISLDVQGRARLDTAFRVGADAMSTWLHSINTSTLAQDHFYYIDFEMFYFQESMLQYKRMAKSYAKRAGIAESYSVNNWYEQIQSWDQLKDDDDGQTCPICYEGYVIPLEATMASLKTYTSDECVPVQLAYNHIICRPCLGTLASSRHASSSKCPSCRGKLPPVNTQLANSRLLDNIIRNAMPEERAVDASKSSLALLDDYLRKLPEEVSPHHDLAHPSGDALTDWRRQVLQPGGDIVREHFLDHGCVCKENPCPCYMEEAVQNTKRGQMSLEGIRLIQARLAAFLSGDEECYKAACRDQLFLLTEYCTVVHTRNMMHHFGHWSAQATVPDMAVD